MLFINNLEAVVAIEQARRDDLRLQSAANLKPASPGRVAPKNTRNRVGLPATGYAA